MSGGNSVVTTETISKRYDRWETTLPTLHIFTCAIHIISSASLNFIPYY
jgi:hypothetical protein